MTENNTKPRTKTKFIAILLSLLVTLLILEAGARLWLNFIAPEATRFEYSVHSYLKPDDQRYTPHHYLNYYPNPGYERGGTTHNALGYRNEEFPVIKPEGEFRIVAIGGSSTYSISVKDNEQTFTAQLAKILREKYGYENVRVINAGVGGYNSSESLINFEFRVLDLDPDLVIVYHGTNDVHTRFVDPEFYRGDNSGRRKQWTPPMIPLLEHSAVFRIVLRKSGITKQVGVGNFVNADTAYGPYSVSKHDPMTLLDKNPPIYFRRNLNNMIGIANANDVDIMFATWAYSTNFDDYASTPYYQRGFNENNEVVMEVAGEKDIPVLDFASIMPAEKKYWADGRHVNAQGAKKKAEIFADFINREELIPH